MIKRIKQILTYLILFSGAALILIPMYMTITGTFMEQKELQDYIAPVLNNKSGYATWTILPIYPTTSPIVELLLDSPRFFIMFWNSVKQVFPIIVGQLIVATLAAWSLAKFRFIGREIVYKIYIVLMILPFQVTMVSSYLVLSQTNLLDTYLSIILPGIFSTFPVFIMIQFFESVPEELMEAAKLDGAGNWKTFCLVGLPIGYPGIISALVLSFLEYWNAMEQPMTFLKDKSRWPLSLYLPQISADKVAVSFSASIVMMLPALFLFLFGQSYLEQGIVASGMKQ